MTEICKPVRGFGGHYEASTLGRVRCVERTVVRLHPSKRVVAPFTYAQRLLKQSKLMTGYMRVHIGVDCKRISIGVHRLVLLAFAGECPDGMVACHNNGASDDNRPENLRWDTQYENNQDRKRHGTYATGEAHPMAKLTADVVARIRTSELGPTLAAKRFGVSKSTVSRILRGESWK